MCDPAQHYYIVSWTCVSLMARCAQRNHVAGLAPVAKRDGAVIELLRRAWTSTLHPAPTITIDNLVISKDLEPCGRLCGAFLW